MGERTRSAPQDTAVEVAVLIADVPQRLRVRDAVERAGYRAVVPRPLLAWVEARRPHVLLVTDDAERTAQLREQIRAVAPETGVLVLAGNPSPYRYRQLLSSCTAVLPDSATEEELIVAVEAAYRALTCLPVTAARAALTGDDGERPRLTGREATWLRALADGATVAGLARSAGYSQREMYRILANLYERLGSRSRTEALLRADRWGLLAEPSRVAPPVAGAGVDRGPTRGGGR